MSDLNECLLVFARFEQEYGEALEAVIEERDPDLSFIDETAYEEFFSVLGEVVGLINAEDPNNEHNVTEWTKYVGLVNGPVFKQELTELLEYAEGVAKGSLLAGAFDALSGMIDDLPSFDDDDLEGFDDDLDPDGEYNAGGPDLGFE